jgi:drug/metabolite transporter (DMT)-like permease
MQIIYLLLLSVLLATYFIVLRRVLRRSSELTPTLGWIIGLGFFVVAPLSIMTVSGGFALPAVYGVDRPWGSVDLSNQVSSYPTS